MNKLQQDYSRSFLSCKYDFEYMWYLVVTRTFGELMIYAFLLSYKNRHHCEKKFLLLLFLEN